MSKAALRAVNPNVDHPRDRARRDVKRWRSNAEKEKLPVVNQWHSGAPNLSVDAVLQRTLRTMPEVEDDKSFPWLALIAIIGGVIGIIWLFTS